MLRLTLNLTNAVEAFFKHL